MGEFGVCGKRLAEPLYWYRRHPTGRLAWLKANRELWTRAYQAMRQLHIESYNGRYSDMCCGKGAAKSAPIIPARSAQVIAAEAAATPGDKLTQLAYSGPRAGDFMIVSGVTRTRYRVPGRGALVEQAETGRKGVIPPDVAWFKSIAQGAHFQVIEPPKPAPPIVAQPIAETPSEASEAWKPAIMESVPLPEVEAAPVVKRRKRGNGG